MKIDDFINYKMLIESDEYISDEKAEQVFLWMQETGRIDESFFGSVWSWLKRNLSITARKLYALADEYEKELIAEIKAEWDTLEYKTIADKWRRGSYMKLSNDIEERMEIIANDDEDYRKLVKVLINKKNLKVKRLLLSHFSKKLDPDFVQQEIERNSIEERRLTKEEQACIKEDPKEYFNKSVYLKNKIKTNKKFYESVKINDGNKDEFISLILLYVKKLSKIDKNIKNDNETVLEFAKKYVNSVLKILHKIETSDVTKEEALDIIKKQFNKLLREEKPLPFERMVDECYKRTIEEIKDIKNKKNKKDIDIDIDKLDVDIVTKNTKKVSDVDVKDTLKKVADDIDSSDEEEISEEIEEAVKKYFKENIGEIYNRLKYEVDVFNKKSNDEKIKFKNEFNYKLNDDNSLDKPTLKDLEFLLEDFVKIAGMIVPYYNFQKNSKYASLFVADQIIHIYAIKKDVSNRLSEKDVEFIINAIKNYNKKSQ